MMNDETKLHDAFADTPKLHDTRRPSLRRVVFNPVVCSIAAAIGMFGGISSLVAGVACIVIHSVIPGDRAFDQVGTTLLILGIPMLLLGSIFLDEIEVKER
jgi:uncharacterized membrane protein YtjA (UPF0391 family)